MTLENSKAHIFLGVLWSAVRSAPSAPLYTSEGLANTMTSGSILAEISVRSPRKLFIFIIYSLSFQKMFYFIWRTEALTMTCWIAAGSSTGTTHSFKRRYIAPHTDSYISRAPVNSDISFKLGFFGGDTLIVSILFFLNTKKNWAVEPMLRVPR